MCDASAKKLMHGLPRCIVLRTALSVAESLGRVIPRGASPLQSMAKPSVPLSITSTGPTSTVRPVLFFVHGWPDDASVWRAQVEYFKTKYHCKCVTMPHFGGREMSFRLGHREEGYNFYELADILAENIRSECRTPVILILHDWGCIWGFLMQARYPGLVKSIVALDVGQPSCVTGLDKALGAFFAYQFLPLAAFFIIRATARLGPTLRDWGRWVADGAIRGFIWLAGHGSRSITADASYPYFHYLKGQGFRDAPKVSSGATLPTMPSCPCLFMYAKRKPFMFHSKAWAEHLKKRSDCHVIPVNAGMKGHWLQVEKAQEVNEAIEKWLE